MSGSPATADQLRSRLLPAPTTLLAGAGHLQIGETLIISADPDIPPEARPAIARPAERLALRLQRPLRLETTASENAAIRLRLAGGPPPAPGSTPAEAYRLTITPQQATLTAAGPLGLVRGLQTLEQITFWCHDRWPALEIDDQPAFPIRGISLDVSRGRVPTLATLEDLVDRLALLKFNHLQLYVEHTFAFRFDPEIGGPYSPLTPDDITRLDAFCREREVDLVPSLASAGHMGRILSMPQYRHLAEIPSDKTWEQMTWRERVRGLTLNVCHPDARALLMRMYEELLPLFSAPLANISCDETFDLGQGQSRTFAPDTDIGELYLDHILFLADICRRHGKRPMVWSDVLKNHPDVLPRMPRDILVLNWGYTLSADYDTVHIFRDAGLDTVVCPGANGWNRPLQGINVADENTRRHAAAGQRHGACGLLTTEWGDEGHVNPLAGDWHPFALAAALAWNPAAPPAADFDRAAGPLLYDDHENAIIPLLRRVAEVCDLPRSWPAFFAPLDEAPSSDELDEARIAQWRQIAAEAAQFFAQRLEQRPQDADGLELHAACRLNALIGERFALSRALAASSGPPETALATELTGFAERCEAFVPVFESAWRRRSRSSGLQEVSETIRRVAKEARQRAKEAGK